MNEGTSGPVGLIGLGRMGSAIGSRLRDSGYELVVQNRTKDSAIRFAAKYGATVVPTPRLVAESAEFVLTSVADEPALHDVCTGEHGLLSGLTDRSLVIETGTTGPAVVERLAPRINEIGADLLESPVSGTPDRARRGELVVMVGGSDHAYERALGLLNVLGTPLHVGPVGTATGLKLAVNLVLFGLNQATLEGLKVAEVGGVGAETFLAALRASPAGARIHDFLLPQYLDPNTPVGAGTYGTVSKDLALLVELAGAVFDDLTLAPALLERVGAIVGADGEDIELGAARTADATPVRRQEGSEQHES